MCAIRTVGVDRIGHRRRRLLARWPADVRWAVDCWRWLSLVDSWLSNIWKSFEFHCQCMKSGADSDCQWAAFVIQSVRHCPVRGRVLARELSFGAVGRVWAKGNVVSQLSTRPVRLRSDRTNRWQASEFDRCPNLTEGSATKVSSKHPKRGRESTVWTFPLLSRCFRRLCLSSTSTLCVCGERAA